MGRPTGTETSLNLGKGTEGTCWALARGGGGVVDLDRGDVGGRRKRRRKRMRGGRGDRIIRRAFRLVARDLVGGWLSLGLELGLSSVVVVL